MVKKGAVIAIAISAVFLAFAIGILGRDYSQVKQAEKNLNTACEDLKQSTLVVKNAAAKLANVDPGNAKLPAAYQGIQTYNERCAKMTGAL